MIVGLFELKAQIAKHSATAKGSYFIGHLHELVNSSAVVGVDVLHGQVGYRRVPPYVPLNLVLAVLRRSKHATTTTTTTTTTITEVTNKTKTKKTNEKETSNTSIWQRSDGTKRRKQGGKKREKKKKKSNNGRISEQSNSKRQGRKPGITNKYPRRRDLSLFYVAVTIRSQTPKQQQDKIRDETQTKIDKTSSEASTTTRDEWRLKQKKNKYRYRNCNSMIASNLGNQNKSQGRSHTIKT